MFTVNSNGTKIWRNSNGERHRLGGPAVEYMDGGKEWYKEGKLHRLDGPAWEWIGGSKEWWMEGQLHRLDGPAIERYDGTNYWYIEGVKVTEEEYPADVLLYKCKQVLES